MDLEMNKLEKNREIYIRKYEYIRNFKKKLESGLLSKDSSEYQFWSLSQLTIRRQLRQLLNLAEKPDVYAGKTIARSEC